MLSFKIWFADLQKIWPLIYDYSAVLFLYLFKVIEFTLTSILPMTSKTTNLKYLKKVKAFPSALTENADRSRNFFSKDWKHVKYSSEKYDPNLKNK